MFLRNKYNDKKVNKITFLIRVDIKYIDFDILTKIFISQISNKFQTSIDVKRVDFNSKYACGYINQFLLFIEVNLV